MEPETPTLISDSFPNRKTPYWMSMLLLAGFILILFAAFIGFARADGYDNTPPPVCTMVCSPNGLVCVTQCH